MHSQSLQDLKLWPKDQGLQSTVGPAGWSAVSGYLRGCEIKMSLTSQKVWGTPGRWA